jgi:zinc protease
MRIFLVFLLSGAALSAQGVDRTQPPPPTEPRPYKLPLVFETQLPNGLTVVLIDDARVPLVTMRVVFPCGNRRDPGNAPGLAAAVAEMLPQGTTHRNFIQIFEAIDGLGGALNAGSGADQIFVNGSIDSRNFPALLDIMADVARNADFPLVDLTLYKQNRKQTLARQRAQPAFAANEAFRKALFGEHPYAHLGPTQAALEGLNRDALIEFRDKWLVPNNAFLIAVGRLPARAEMMKLVADHFGTWEKKPLSEPKPEPLPAPLKERRLILIDRPGAVQVDMRVGHMAAVQRDPDYFAEVIASAIVGAVPAGRLFADLREKRGFAYDARTEHQAFDEAGVLSAATQVRPEVAAQALQALLDHLDAMAATPVTDSELTRARGQITGSFLFRLETQAGLMDELMIDKVQKLPAAWLETWRTRMEAVTAADVQAAAKKYLATAGSVIVVVGDAAKIGPSLEKIGKFEVVKSLP